MGKQDEKTGEPKDLRRQVREIADSLAIAFILAMVIRHYVLEVFKIPTKSMQPTLLGDPWTGDKILVNKFAYDFRDPRRWEVAVFKYPEDTSKNYIKRVVGLPGESVQVRDGDVYINDAIASKPWSVQEALWRRRLHSEKAEFWQPDDRRYWELADDSFVVDCQSASEPQYLTYRREILAYEERDFRESRRPFQRMTTSDVMVQFRLVPLKLAGTVHVAIDVETSIGIPDTVEKWNVRIPLGEGPCRPEVFHSRDLVKTGEACTFQEGRPALVQVCHVDRTLLVRVDGRDVASHPYSPSRRVVDLRGYESQARIQLGCKQGHVAFRDTSLYADVFYTDGPPDKYGVRLPYQLQADEFFVLGDNSANSNDSRGWRAVPRRYLVGEAFLVLWPLGRMKLVR